MMQGQPIPPAYKGQELEEGYVELFRKPVYDIVIKPQKRSPYSKLAQNELAKELYNLGFFNPQYAEMSMTALELMDFDGIEGVKQRVQQGQTLLNMVNQLAQELALIKGTLGMATEGTQEPVSAPRVSGGRSMGQAQKAAQTANMTDYGARLASRAKPNVSV
jgi:hypothetical protein